MKGNGRAHDTLVALGLPPAVKVQTLKLLARIRQAASADDLWRATGFVLGQETVEALDAARLKGLDGVATARRQE